MKNPQKKGTAITVRPEQAQETVAVETFITQAIANNVPVETLEKIFALREKVKAEQARAAFLESLSVFQGECPVIKKDKKVLNKDGTLRYMFAPLDSIVDQIKGPLAESNLSYRWETKQENGNVRAICIVTHILGHSESSDFDVPVDTEGYMTKPQKFASALTFAKRYSLCNALGISTGDEDTDATDVIPEKDAKSVKAQITIRLRTLGEDTKSKESIEKAVKKLVNLDLKEESYEEIASRLQILIDERHEGSDIR
jgi:hypothetical protein